MALAQCICKEISLPLCSVLNFPKAQYACESREPFGIEVNAPYTLAALIIGVLCAFRMIWHVNSLHSSIGKGEMRTFFLLYIVSNGLQFALLGYGHLMPDALELYLTTLQVGFQCSMYFAIFIAGITIDRIYGILGMKSSTFMRALTLLFFFGISSGVFLTCTTQDSIVLILVIAINALSMFFYLLLQLPKLRKTNSDIWAYGILAIISMIFILVNIHMFTCGFLIQTITDGNLDNLFFHTVFSFLLIMMIHKYWLSTCDFELECLTLNA